MTTSAVVRIVDDDPLVAESLRFLLEIAGYRVIAFDDARTFLQTDDHTQLGCVILDIRMPEMTGLECQQAMIEAHDDLPIVFLSAHADVEMAVEAVQKGASGFVVKPPKTPHLLAEIQKAVALHARRLSLRAEVASSKAVLARLTPAELETAQLIAKGLTNADIASLLGISEGTVRHRRMSISEKLDAQNAVEVGELFHWLDACQKELP